MCSVKHKYWTCAPNQIVNIAFKRAKMLTCAQQNDLTNFHVFITVFTPKIWNSSTEKIGTVIVEAQTQF